MEIQEKIIHQGHNAKRIRLARGYKQEWVAEKLFDGRQPSVSNYEQMPVIDDVVLTKFAQLYKVDIDIFRTLEEDVAKTIIENNTFEIENGVGVLTGINPVNNCNPLEEILKLSKEKEELYERLLKNEQERNIQLLKHCEELNMRMNKLENKK